MKSAPIRRLFASALAALLLTWVTTPALAHHVVEAAGPVVANTPVESVAGTVEELIVENRVTGLTTRHLALRFADGSGVPLRGADMGSLPTGAQVRVTGRRNGQELSVESAQITALPRTLAKAGAPASEYSGTLALLHSDDFAAGEGHFLFELHEDGGKIRQLDLLTLPESLRGGMRVLLAARLRADGVSLTPERIIVLGLPGASLVAKDGLVAKAATMRRVIPERLGLRRGLRSFRTIS